MNVYKVQFKKWNDVSEKYVFAKDAAQAIEFARRWYKKNNYSSDADIILLSREVKVDIYYKSSSK